jgi:hypothetical protein
MRQFEDESFHQLYDRGDQLLLENMRFKNCEFVRCAISLTEKFGRMSTVRNVELLDCALINCQTGPTIFSDVTITNLKTSDLLILWCPYLDKVTLSGEIGKLKVNAAADTSTVGPANYYKQKPFDDYRDKFYANVDWALDISKARFKELDLESVPARLVRRDPESQAIVTREKALQFAKEGWRKLLPPECKHWAIVVDMFLSDGEEDIVLVAPLGAAKAKRDPLLKGLQEFRRIGLAEPD